MAGDLDCRKYTSMYLFTFTGGAISWQSKLQKCVPLSTIEAEHIVATEGGKEILYMDEAVYLRTGFKTKKLHSTL